MATSSRGLPWMTRGEFTGPTGLSKSPPWTGPRSLWLQGVTTGIAASLSFAGMFCWPPCSRYLPGLYRELARLQVKENRPSLADVYQNCPSISLDHGILEKAENVAVVPVEMGWNDVGTWEAVHELFPRDERANVLLGRVLDQGSRDCILLAQNRLVATIGLERIIVVDTPDATLVCHRDRAQEVKDLVAELHRQQMVESVHHTTVERPWGRYSVMDEGPSFKVKRIVVDPGQKLSLQVHQHRAEHWVVVTGTARVTIGQEIRLVASNQKRLHPPEDPASPGKPHGGTHPAHRGPDRGLPGRRRHPAPGGRLLAPG